MIRFGAAGNSQSFYDLGFTQTVQTAAYLKERGLNAFEYSFGRGVNMRSETAREIAKEMSANDVAISAHAPYYINLAGEEIEKSIGYIVSSVRMLQALGGNRCVVHSGSQGKLGRDEALLRVRRGFEQALERLDELGYDYILCPEAMGKFPQIGTYSEVADLCTLSDKMIPCYDFGHINSITQGGLKTADDYKRIIDYALDLLGERAKRLHIHFSKIMYGAKGEIKHLNYDDAQYGPEFDPLAKVIYEYGLEPVVICESAGMQAEDAMTMKNIYNKLI